ncbi:MAG: S41 family peptidase, partial [Planctomycetota bacterium]
VLGERSFGKGSVQNVWGLPGNTSAQKLTTQYYRLPSGRIIHREPGSAEWGVDPDLEIPMLPEQYADSIRLRIEADVIQLDENGNVLEGDEPRPDPNTLLSEGTDLQLKTALTLLQSRVSAASPIAGRTGVEPAGVQN